jgi:hypothetical protein
VVNPDLPWASQEPQDSYYYTTTEIPDRVKQAQMELALMLLSSDSDATVRDSQLDLKRDKTDVLEQEWFPAKDRATGLDRYPYVLNRLIPLLDEAAGVMTVVRT